MKYEIILFSSLFLIPCLLEAQGNTFNPDDVVEVDFTIGDYSGSHSERWKMDVSGGPTTLQVQSANYGEVTTKTYNQFRKGNTYNITVSHVGTHPGYTASTKDEECELEYNGGIWCGSPSPDYDYWAFVEVTSDNVGWVTEETNEEDPLLGVSSGNETNEASGKTAKLHIVKVEFPDSPYGKPNDASDLQPNQIISNDVQFPPSFPSIDEDERAVTISFNITPQTVLDKYIDKFAFTIASSSPEDFGSGNGTIDDTDFISSKGADPIMFSAKQELLTDKSWDNPSLQTQTLGISVEFDGIEVFLLADTEGYNPPVVKSRFFYLIDNRSDFDSALEFVKFKFGLLSLTEDPIYDNANAAGAAGLTVAKENAITAWFEGVYLGDSAFASGAFLASVMVHEETHVMDGAEVIVDAGRGRLTYNSWKAGGFTASLSSSEVFDIRQLIFTEINATTAQITDTTWQNLNPSQQNDIADYQATFNQMESDLQAAGY